MTYQTALGIATGDIITTSYGTGPYIVKSMSNPVYWYKGLDLVVYSYPVVSLTLLSQSNPRSGEFYISDIRQVGERWFSRRNEIHVVKTEQVVQLNMFESELPCGEAHKFTEGVDYCASDVQVWHCERCRKDFNSEKRGLAKRPCCPQCGSWPLPLIYINDDHNAFLRSLNFPTTPK